MNDDTSDRRARPRPRPAAAARVTGIACLAGIACVLGLALLLAAACGGGSPAPPASPQPPSPGVTQALAYAQCMRSHGIPGFPDPNPPGSGGQFPPGNIDAHSPQYEPADKTCQKLTGFGHFPAAQQQQEITTLLKYTECMRSHGITNWPDPFANNQQVGFNITSTDINAPKVKAASKTCQPLWPRP